MTQKPMQPQERFYPATPDFRDAFGRDRDRIIHSSYFRRLEYKTQVFINHSGDYFRTRLTHSLEVSQIARTLAKNLGLNENLAEAIALAHDLGHTPFGHAGGDELDKTMRHYGFHHGFDHNFQSFRVVTKLEKRYKDFEGLNLSFATLEGILKHSYPYEKSFINSNLQNIFRVEFHPSLEAILVDLSDEIAYISADIDALVARALEFVEREEGITRQDSIFRHRFTSRLITMLVYDILDNYKPFVQDSVRCFTTLAKESLPISHTKTIEQEIKALKKILLKCLYRHQEIYKKMFMGKRCVRKLYDCFNNETSLLPKDLQARISNGEKIHRVCADYIASMTDRYAIALYHELGF